MMSPSSDYIESRDNKAGKIRCCLGFAYDSYLCQRQSMSIARSLGFTFLSNKKSSLKTHLLNILFFCSFFFLSSLTKVRNSIKQGGVLYLRFLEN